MMTVRTLALSVLSLALLLSSAVLGWPMALCAALGAILALRSSRRDRADLLESMRLARIERRRQTRMYFKDYDLKLED